MSNEISEVTRRAIIDRFRVIGISWCGRFGDDDFLARLYDLTKLPSRDHRYRNAAGCQSAPNFDPRSASKTDPPRTCFVLCFGGNF